MKDFKKIILFIVWIFLLLFSVYIFLLLNSFKNIDTNNKYSNYWNELVHSWTNIIEEVLDSEVLIEEENNDILIEKDNKEDIELTQEQQDYIILNEASNKWNVETCKEIINEEIKQDCFDNVHLSNAYSENSRNYCYKIDNEQLKNKCLNNFIYNAALESDDYSNCNKITDNELLVESCKSTIIFSQIQEKWFDEWISICNNLNKENKNYCIKIIESNWEQRNDVELLENALENKDVSYCDKIYTENIRLACSDTINFNLAIDNKDISYCNLINDTNRKESCILKISELNDKFYYSKAINNIDLLVCENIVNEELQFECKDIINFKIAIKNKDIWNCDLIEDYNKKSECNEILQKIQ